MTRLFGGFDLHEEKENGAPSLHLEMEEVLTTDLNIPWALETRGGRFYITERPGTIVEINQGEVSRWPLETTKEVAHEGEGGLLGLALAPDFEKSRIAYVYHTYREGEALFNRVIEVQQQKARWVESRVLLEGIPGEAIHNGGRMKIGPDEKLYVTTGDAAVPEWAQDLNNLAGKILRMELDGSVPEDNPFPDSYVFSYGHRNPQGLAWDERERLYSSEHGPGGHDEINLIESGNNYGWPEITGDKQQEGMVAPLFHSGENTWAPSGLAVHERGLFMAGLRGEQVRWFQIEHVHTEVMFSGEGRLRDILIDGHTIYVLTNNTDGRGQPQPGDDRLLRLSFREAVN
ncbi:glucose/arabinose dehydrogenase [Caldalkalibacillus uzonensis]|uniref:Glucose/arabinose dehydrogenase n=1 Tax=Caldalkalibacillus uzonensis TaxID=353224 RepID=A0ABU0CNA0_9BACI|nr:PQQ-dependent sugar dehydrogenase [Caldalkalibacillus uzonensis]MDQ0337896.1 glucose/arabinose dehydrogenase [Caldalkalibacillus uzonensis]